MRIIYGLLLTLFVLLPCYGKLGDDEVQITTRYGSALTSKYQDPYTIKVFKKDGFDVGVVFHRGYCVLERLSASTSLTPETCLTLAQAIGGAGPWSKVEGIAKNSTSWTNANSIALFETTQSEQALTVMTKVHAKRLADSDQLDAAKVAKSFGGVTSPPVSDEQKKLAQEKLLKEKEQKKIAAEERALAWNRTQAENGDAYSQYRMGMRYLNGEGVKPDTRIAREWLTKAAAQDHAQAKATLSKPPFQ